jgi:hypothetical protein
MGTVTNQDLQRSTVKIRGGVNYLPVAVRLKVFREKHPDWGIKTEPLQISIEGGYAVFQTTLMDETGRVIATGTSLETARGFPDFVEKAETSSLGRALSVAGFGGDATQYDLDEGDGHVVDSPQPAREPAREPIRREPVSAPLSEPLLPVSQAPDGPLRRAQLAFGDAARELGFSVDMPDGKPSRSKIADLLEMVATWAEWDVTDRDRETAAAWQKGAELLLRYVQSREESGAASG